MFFALYKLVNKPHEHSSAYFLLLCKTLALEESYCGQGNTNQADPIL